MHLHLSWSARTNCREARVATLIHINAVQHWVAQQLLMIDWLGGLCTSDTALRGGLLFGLFVAGMAGSVVHCGPMCGAFVLGQMSERMVRLPAVRLCEWQRIENGLLLPYHLGRLTTYAGLGALAAGSAAIFGRAARLSAALLAVAAALFLAQALKRILPTTIRIDRVPRAWGMLIAAVSRRAKGEFLLGLTLGFLPCGFLYAALAAAGASGRPWVGAAAMVAFGLGTTPALMVVAVAGHAAGRRWNGFMTRGAPVLMTFNALLLLILAWRS